MALRQAAGVLLLCCFVVSASAVKVSTADCKSNNGCNNCLNQGLSLDTCGACLIDGVDQNLCYNCLAMRTSGDPSGCVACASLNGTANACVNCIAQRIDPGFCLACSSPGTESTLCYNCLAQQLPGTDCMTCGKNAGCFNCLAQRLGATLCASCLGATQGDMCYNCLAQRIPGPVETCISCDAGNRTLAGQCYNCLAQRPSNMSICTSAIPAPVACGGSTCDASLSQICVNNACATSCAYSGTGLALLGTCSTSNTTALCGAQLNSTSGIIVLDGGASTANCTSNTDCTAGQICAGSGANAASGSCAPIALPSCLPITAPSHKLTGHRLF